VKSHFLELIAKTTETLGSTAPNPAVGAAAIDASGAVLSLKFHPGAGQPHAEALVIKDCRARGILDQVDTLLVTLEPCNHTGRTPPCTQAIITAGIKHVRFAVKDPNPKVAGGGETFLKAAGIDAAVFDDAEVAREAKNLLRAFAHWSETGRPWVTVKRALTASGSMIPPAGEKTFTSPESLKLAHELRRRADAILTGSGTVLADHPLFTVRHVSDHPGKIRDLVVMDRRGRVQDEAWIHQAENSGFRVHFQTNLHEAMGFLGARGVLEVLVEAGPAVSSAILDSGLWNESITIKQVPGKADTCSAALSKKQQK